MNHLPLVSICIPTYNNESYIELMLQTILNQTYKNIEVIISDNFSYDNTFEILKSYKNKYNWDISQNSSNVGALNNMSKLIQRAQGKYVALYHSDDLYDPHIVEKSVAVLESLPEVSLVSTMGESIDEKGNKLFDFRFPGGFTENRSHSFDFIFKEILSQRPFFLITPSVMTRGEYYKLNSTFNKRYKSSADYGMWFEILQKGDLYIINESLIKYRTHEQQGTFLEIKGNFRIPDCIPLYEDYAKLDFNKYGSQFKFAYYKLMLVQAIKLNNIGRFNRSIVFLRMILKRSIKYLFPWVFIYLIFDYLKIKYSIDNLIIIKKWLKK